MKQLGLLGLSICFHVAFPYGVSSMATSAWPAVLASCGCSANYLQLSNFNTHIYLTVPVGLHGLTGSHKAAIKMSAGLRSHLETQLGVVGA